MSFGPRAWSTTSELAHLTHAPLTAVQLEGGVKGDGLVFCSVGTGIEIGVRAGNLCLRVAIGQIEPSDGELGFDVADQLKELLPSSLLHRRHAWIHSPEVAQAPRL